MKATEELAPWNEEEETCGLRALATKGAIGRIATNVAPGIATNGAIGRYERGSWPYTARNKDATRVLTSLAVRSFQERGQVIGPLGVLLFSLQVGWQMGAQAMWCVKKMWSFLLCEKDGVFVSLCVCLCA